LSVTVDVTPQNTSRRSVPGAAWTSGLSATLPRRGFRWAPSEQPASGAQPPRAAGRLHGGRAWLTLALPAWLTLAVRAWLTLALPAWLTLAVRAWLTLAVRARRRRRSLHVLLADVVGCQKSVGAVISGVPLAGG
jgi:hypothetical protein